MARSESPQTGMVASICAAATPVYFYLAAGYLGYVHGMLGSAGIFAYWRWIDAVHALAAVSIALPLQIAVFCWSWYKRLRTDLPRLTIYVSVYWILVSVVGSALYGLSTVNPPGVYLSPRGLAGPSWVKEYRVTFPAMKLKRATPPRR